MATDEKVYVPYGDFVDGVQALADLDAIRAVITKGDGYCSKSIMAILGLGGKENAGSDDIGK